MDQCVGWASLRILRRRREAAAELQFVIEKVDTRTGAFETALEDRTSDREVFVFLVSTSWRPDKMCFLGFAGDLK